MNGCAYACMLSFGENDGCRGILVGGKPHMGMKQMFRMMNGARIAVGRALIGVLVGEFFAASEGIGYAIARFGDLFALDRMFACIITIMIIAVAFTEGIRWAERTAFPWRVGR